MSLPLRPVPQPFTAPQRAAPAGERARDRTGEREKVEIITPDQYTDRRSEPRQTCDGKGALLFLSSREIFTCRILDQSASGARVSMENVGNIPAEIWLIDLDTHIVKRGTAAWSMANRMGLKFNFIQNLVSGMPRPAKVPQEVYDAWLRLSNSAPPAPEPDDDALYFD